MEIIIVGAIILFILVYNNTINKDKFFADNQKYLDLVNTLEMLEDHLMASYSNDLLNDIYNIISEIISIPKTCLAFKEDVKDKVPTPE